MFRIKGKEKVSKPNTSTTKTGIPSRGLQCIRGLSEKPTPILLFQQYGMGTFYKPFNTLRSLFVHPKDKTKNYKKYGVVYNISCSDCGEEFPICSLSHIKNSCYLTWLKPKTTSMQVFIRSCFVFESLQSFWANPCKCNFSESSVFKTPHSQLYFFPDQSLLLY